VPAITPPAVVCVTAKPAPGSLVLVVQRGDRTGSGEEVEVCVRCCHAGHVMHTAESRERRVVVAALPVLLDRLSARTLRRR
jgi:hypothetical protein